MATERFARLLFSGVIPLVALVLLCGCDGGSTQPASSESSGSSGSSGSSERDPGAIRIASFSPALTRMLVDLGAEQRIVGRTQYCGAVDPDIPVIGNLYAIDFESLLRIDPTHLVLQPPATGVNQELLNAAEEHGWEVFSRPGLDSIEDIAETVRSLAEALGEAALIERAEALGESLLRLAHEPDQPEVGRRVLIVTVDSEVRAFGEATYLSDMIRSRGLRNAVEENGWIALTLEDVARLKPDGIIIVKPGVSADQRAEDLAGPLAELDVPAVRTGRVSVLRHAEAILPSTSLLEVDDELAAIVKAWNDRSP